MPANSAHKRKHSAVPEESSKRSASQSDPAELGITPENVLKYISADELKSVVQTLLADPAAGSATKQELLKYQDGALLEHNRRAAQAESLLICEAAHVAALEALEESKEERCGERNWWPEKLRHLLPRVEALMAKGHLVNGPTLAWEALEDVVYHSICDYNGQECCIGRREEECDWFHDEVDRLAVRICYEMRKHPAESLSVNKRKKTIMVWRKKAEDAEIRAEDKSAFRTKRYKRSLHYFRTGYIAPGAWLPQLEW